MKKLLAIFLLLPLFSFCQPRTGTIKGVIIYYFNEYQLDKPDIGSKIYVLDSAYAGNFSIQLADTFETCLMYRSLAATYKDVTSMPTEIKTEVNKYHAMDEAAFKDYDSRNFEQLIVLANNDRVNSATVDGAGNYSISVPKGTYYVYIQSHNRSTPLSFSEGLGRVHCRKIRVHEGQTIDVSHKFSLY